MKTFGRYFWHRFSTTWLRLLILSIFSFCFALLCIDTRSYYVDSLRYHSASGYASILFILFALVIIMPAMEFKPFTSKRNIDAVFSFPLSRTKLLLAHYLNGLIHIFCAYTTSYLALIYETFSAFYNSSNYEYLLTIYFISLSLIFAFYSFYSFLYVEANNHIDGIFFQIIWTIFPIVSTLFSRHTLINSLCEKNVRFDPSWFSIVTPLNELSYSMDKILESTHHGSYSMYNPNFFNSAEIFFGYFFWIILGAIALIGMFLSFNRKKAENIGGISNSWFGYKVAIPVGIFMWLDLTFSSVGFAWSVILGSIIATSAYFVYRRSFKLPIYDWLILSGSFVITPWFLEFLRDLLTKIMK